MFIGSLVMAVILLPMFLSMGKKPTMDEKRADGLLPMLLIGCCLIAFVSWFKFIEQMVTGSTEFNNDLFLMAGVVYLGYSIWGAKIAFKLYRESEV